MSRRLFLDLLQTNLDLAISYGVSVCVISPGLRETVASGTLGTIGVTGNLSHDK